MAKTLEVYLAISPGKGLYAKVMKDVIQVKSSFDEMVTICGAATVGGDMQSIPVGHFSALVLANEVDDKPSLLWQDFMNQKGLYLHFWLEFRNGMVTPHTIVALVDE